jgi:hypothetical protein
MTLDPLLAVVAATGELAIVLVVATGEVAGNGFAKAVIELSACLVAVEHEVSVDGSTLTSQPSPTQVKIFRRFILIFSKIILIYSGLPQPSNNFANAKLDVFCQIFPS